MVKLYCGPDSRVLQGKVIDSKILKEAKVIMIYDTGLYRYMGNWKMYHMEHASMEHARDMW